MLKATHIYISLVGQFVLAVLTVAVLLAAFALLLVQPIIK
jgi:hypothetical protein